jgi:hypothetical protein
VDPDPIGIILADADPYSFTQIKLHICKIQYNVQTIKNYDTYDSIMTLKKAGTAVNRIFF